MAYEFKLPDLGEGLTEGEVARWLVSEGQEVAEDDPLVEIQTDKTTVEIPSPAAGKVASILVAEGQVVAVGTVLVVIGEGATALEDEQPRAEPAPQQEAAKDVAPAAQPPVRVSGPGEGVVGEPGGSPAATAPRGRATPLVRRIARELGVDIDALSGSGPQGQITEGDVRGAVQESDEREAGRREPLRGVRRLIAEHLTTSHREVPAVTVVEECDFTELDSVRGERTYLPYLLEASVAGLKAYPELNATLARQEIVFWERYDLGVAVQTDEGLLVPVLRSADEKSLDELEAEAARLAEAARGGRLKAEELRGSTFTVTSAGRLGGLFATPLVNHPEVGILGLHRIAARPAVVDGEIVSRKIGWLSCTFDHRVVDGARASEFLLQVIERLQTPSG